MTRRALVAIALAPFTLLAAGCGSGASGQPQPSGAILTSQAPSQFEMPEQTPVATLTPRQLQPESAPSSSTVPASSPIPRASPTKTRDPKTAPETKKAKPSTAPPTSNCDPNYARACVPIVSWDLDCGDIRAMVEVVGRDVHRFDADKDGWGCESYG